MIIKINDSLLLEILEDKHAESIFNLVNVNRVHLREWLPWVIKMQTIEHFKGFIIGSQLKYSENSDIAFVIIYDGNIAGRIGVYNIDNQNKIGSIGYWLGIDYQGNRLIDMACIALLDYCFTVLDLNRIEIKCGTKNYKSQAVPKRLNFINEGVIRQGEYIHNGFMDLFCYSMLKNDWNK